MKILRWRPADQLFDIADELDAAVDYQPGFERPDNRGVLARIDPEDFEVEEEEGEWLDA